MNQFKYSYTYDGNNNLIEDLRQHWYGSIWLNDTRVTYIYNVNNNKTEDLWQIWDGLNWANDYKLSFTYDGDNNLIEELGQHWGGFNWINDIKSFLSYIPTEIEEFVGEVSKYSLANNYPNPFNPSTTIEYQIPELSFVAIKVFDVIGNEITILLNEEKPAGSYEVKFNAEGLSSGIYFYQLIAGDFVKTKKMILIR